MKRSLLVALLAIATAATPLLSQDGDKRPVRKKSPVKAEMQKMEDALDLVADWLKKPEGDAPMASITEAAVAMIEAKKHAPLATARQPEGKQKQFVKNFQIEINKVLRNILDLEDAMLNGDNKAAEKILGGMKDIEKAGHKVFKPRRRRGGAKIGGNTAGGGKQPQSEKPQSQKQQSPRPQSSKPQQK